jgi:hypothetical protein
MEKGEPGLAVVVVALSDLETRCDFACAHEVLNFVRGYSQQLTEIARANGGLATAHVDLHCAFPLSATSIR